MYRGTVVDRKSCNKGQKSVPRKPLMDATSKTVIFRAKGGRVEELLDEVAAESAFTLYVNDEVLVSLLCTPTELDTMAVGFLLSEGILRERQALLALDVDETNASVYVKLAKLPDNWDQIFHKKTITSGCGQGVTFTDSRSLQDLAMNRSPLLLEAETIRALLREFRNISDLYLRTGGVHSAALADKDQIVLFSEDIGRHNAVDKLIGKAFLAGVSLDDKVLLSSGRISGEIMTKVIRNRIPVLVSRTAPTCMSISYAENHGVTLIGFARGKKMNIYTHPLRIRFAGNPGAEEKMK